MGQFKFFTVLGFRLFFAFFGRFWHFWCFGGDLRVLGVLVSYKINREIKLVVGRVTEGFKGGLREFWGGLARSGGVIGVCVTRNRAHLPLWKSCRAPDLVPDTT